MPRPLREGLEGKLTQEEASSIEGGVDVVGDIAIVKLRPSMRGKEAAVAEALLEGMGRVKAVYGQEGGIEGEFRLRALRHLGGEERTVTVHRENGLRLRLDVQTCYFSPRLSTERLRIAEGVAEGERVLNMFAGVGPFSIIIAKRRKGARVVSCELNEAAYGFHLENNRLNKVNVETLNADAKRLPSLLEGHFDRVLMCHPSQSNEFLPAALSLTRPGGTVHYYRHVTGRTFEEARENLAKELAATEAGGAPFECRRVREIGPRYLELVADLKAP